MEQPTPLNRHAMGAGNEEIALQYLLQKGYRLIKKNFRFSRMGEIDLVMRDGHVYVFVEVKARRSHEFGMPEEAVNSAKRKKIRKVARGFIHINGLTDYEARFDVVAVDYVTGHNGEPEIRHYVNAF